MKALLDKTKKQYDVIMKSPDIKHLYTDQFISVFESEHVRNHCGTLIKHSEKKSDWYTGGWSLKGTTEVWEESQLADTEIDKTVRESSQLSFSPFTTPPYAHYPILKYAAKCLDSYLKEHPIADKEFPPFSVVENYNIIRYKQGEAYHKTHVDYAPDASLGVLNSLTSRRHLTGVCFLTDIDEGGELVFPQQDIKLKSKAGMFVIFPSGWTHAHHTTPPVNETRYVFQNWWGFQ
tara:strand:+ start:603 stop:1304 length:702 start_codon:yes stop_codon:yes gene_type:complete